jgi:hypothetical protein
MTRHLPQEAPIDEHPQVTIRRDAREGVVAETAGPPWADGAMDARMLLSAFGFSRREPDSPLTLRRGAVEGSVVLHLRDLVAALRRTGVRVNADPAYEYLADTATAQARAANHGIDPRVEFMQARPRVEVAVGRHPEFGIVAAVPYENPGALRDLTDAGFRRTANSKLYALQRSDVEPTSWTTDVVAGLRASGLRVSADLAFEPTAPSYAPSLVLVSARARAALASSTCAPAPTAQPVAAAASAATTAHRPTARRSQ